MTLWPIRQYHPPSLNVFQCDVIASNTMKIAIVAPYARVRPHFETDLELAQRHLSAGDQVTVVTCDGGLAACDANPQHTATDCLKCTGRRDAGLKMLSGDFQQIQLFKPEEADTAADENWPDFTDIDQLKAFQHDGMDLGYAVVSSLATLFRDPEFDVQQQRHLVCRLLTATRQSFQATRKLLQAESFDRVYVFNGRFAPLRGVLRACQVEGVECYTHERGRDFRHFTLYENTLPHDIQYVGRRVEQNWAAAADRGDREEVAEQWYQRRAAGKATTWHSFVADQETDSLPEGFDHRKRNLALFTSSEDECAAIGEYWHFGMYRDQLEGVQAIAEGLRDHAETTHLYVRMHPNSAEANSRTNHELAKFSSPAVTVIQPTESIDTYALIQHCDTVISFGSTVGIEAVYWGKPSILIGSSFYEAVGGVYHPQRHEELLALALSELRPQDREAALKYGYYWATLGEPFVHFEPTDLFRGKFRGKRIAIDPWTRVRIQWSKWKRAA